MSTSRTLSACAFLALSFSMAVAQQPAAAQPTAGSSWKQVEALPDGTKIHITTDHGGRTCLVFAVSDDALTCRDHAGNAGRVIPRAEIRHIKLTQYLRSTLVGAAIGGGTGAASGVVIAHKDSCRSGALCIPFTSLLAVVVGTLGAAAGAGVGYGTDFTRGSTIYTRP